MSALSKGGVTRADASGETPSQTVGPYFTMVLGRSTDEASTWREGVPGERIRITGRVLDGDRNPIEDALVEVWQADADGRYAHPTDRWPPDGAFTGYARAVTDFATGVWVVDIVRPGRCADPTGAVHAPHCSVIIQSRGMLVASFTRVYFDDDAALHDADPVLAAVPAPRRTSLIARREEAPGADGIALYHWDVRFQGADETVFFDV